MQPVNVERTRGPVPVQRRHVGLYATGEYPRACPGCNSDASRITRTRETIIGAKTVRDRTCLDCGRKWVTLTSR